MKNPFRRRERPEPDRSVAPRGGAKRLSPDGLQITEFPTSYTQILRLYGVSGNYASIYAHQPNVRTAVDTVAREAAELTLKLYMRDPRGDDLPSSRREMRDERVMQLLREPSPGMSTYRFWFHLFADIEIYDVAYWLKIRQRGVPAALLRVPPQNIIPVRDPFTQGVTLFRTPWGQEYSTTDILAFWGYDPATGHGNIPPMESVRRIIAEDVAAGADREGRWRNSARKEGVIERDIAGKELSDEARESYLIDIEDALAGPTGSGRPLLLLPGDEYKDINWSPREMEYVNARKLNRLEVAAHFHVPPAMIAASADNKQADEDTLRFFYKHSLSPRLTRIEHELEAQLLPEFYLDADNRREFYFEFNMDEKLRASFEERAEIMATTVGGPVLSVNEGRARLNQPATDNPDDDLIYAPMNSVRGGGPQASPQSPTETPATGIEPAGTTPVPRGAGFDAAEWLRKADEDEEINRVEAERKAFLHDVRVRYEERVSGVITRTFERQKRSTGDFKLERWDRELAADLLGVALQAYDALHLEVFDMELLKTQTEAIAHSLNEYTRQSLEDDEDPFLPARAREVASEATAWIEHGEPARTS